MRLKMKNGFEIETKEIRIKFVLTSSYNKAIIDTVKNNIEEFQNIFIANINDDN